MILPGSTVIINNTSSIYNGYEGCVLRISEDKVAVLMDQHTPWDKMITFRMSDLEEKTTGFQYYPDKPIKKRK